MSDTALLNSSAKASHFDEMVPTLTEAQMARLAAHSHLRQVARGEVLVEAGERTARLFVVAAGQIAAAVYGTSAVGEGSIAVAFVHQALHE